MRRLYQSLFGIVATCFVSSTPIFAQTEPNLEVGLKQYGAYHGGNIDTVNLTNGNLFIHIPIFDYPQRGSEPFGINFIFNSKVFTVSTYCDPITGDCTSSWVTPVTVNNGTVFLQYGVGGVPSSVIYNGNNWYSVTTLDGSIHQASISQSTHQWETVDGTSIYFDTVKGPVFPNGDENSGDVNGNYVSNSSQPNELGTDTLGRSVNNVSSTDTTGCTGPLPIQNVQITASPGPAGTTRYIKQCFPTVIPANTHFHAFDSQGLPIAEYQGPGGGIQSIVVYNGSSWATSPAWTFEYGSDYVDVTRITLPTGGTISYTWDTTGAFSNCGYVPASRILLTRSVDAHDGTGPQTTTYQSASVGSLPATVVTDPAGNDVVHVFTALAGTCSLYETQTIYYQGSRTSGTLLKTVTTDYTSLKNPLDILVSFQTNTAINVNPIRETTTWPNGQVSKIERDYDSNLVIGDPTSTNLPRISYGNVIEEREYDYANGAPGALLRRTHYDYLAFSNSQYLSANLVNLPSSAIVYDGIGNQISKTTYGYDEYPLTSSGVTTQHLTTLPNPGIRGNRTSICRWLNTTGGNVCTITKYYDTGMPYQTIDPAGNVTAFSFSGTYVGAYVTQTQFPDTGSPAVHHIVGGAYDFNTGQLSSFVDQNNRTRSYLYDTFGRVTTANFPDGGQTTFTYTDTVGNLNVERRKKITSSLSLDSFVYFDGLGREKQTRLVSDPDGTTYVNTTYDALSRKATVSNSYRSTTEPTYGLTSYVYDALGRVCVVVPPDGTTVSSNTCPGAQPNNDVFTTFAGNTTTVTDQAGNSRKSVSDGLGRLTQVFEASNVPTLNYETDYLYDALNNMTCVAQRGTNTGTFTTCASTPVTWRPRAFAYDSLSRLTSATNPESGTVAYTYDANGNLLYKTSPAPNQTSSATVTLSYCYDALNRLTAKTYTQQSCTNGTLPTPVATYLNDQSSYGGLTIANGIGRRTGMTDQIGSEAWSYDLMGRIATDQRTTNGLTEYFTYTYNLDGSVLTLTYPPAYTGGNRGTVNFQQGGAGRYLSGAVIANTAHYAPNGSLCYLQTSWGTNIFRDYTFNNRFQPVDIYASATSVTPPTPCTTPTLASDLPVDFTYSFVDANGHNNGNVAQITDNQAWPLTQTYTYDSLNRVATAQSSGTHSSAPGTCWAETYNYDAWGNLYSFGPNSTTQSAYIGCSQESGLSSSATNNNQLSTYTYDAAGNLITIPAVANYTYDAENHLVSAGGLNYSYDGDGKRVMKSNGILYWYGAGSDPLFESDTSGYQIFKHFYFNGMRVARQEGWAQGYWIDHYVNDALGNARFVYGYNGAWDVSDYYPFGGEHPYQSQEGNVFKFTGKERDSESALDNFGARYYANAMGRFMSPDPIQHPSQSSWDEETFLATPQRWNEYGYVLNNPLNHTDPNGDEIPVWERRLEGGPPTDTRTALSEALLVGGAGAAASAGGAGVLARAAGYSRGLITAAIGYFLTPQGQQTAQDIAEAVAPPGSNLNVGRIAANLGISSIETLGESGVVGQLSSGASISAGFGRVGGSLAVNISNIASDVKGGVNFFQLQGNAVKAAQAEGLSSVTLTAQNVINSKLAQALVKQGFTKQVTQDARGNQIINYVKQIPVSN